MCKKQRSDGSFELAKQIALFRDGAMNDAKALYIDVC